jgi:hypothetical protein
MILTPFDTCLHAGRKIRGFGRERAADASEVDNVNLVANSTGACLV